MLCTSFDAPRSQLLNEIQFMCTAHPLKQLDAKKYNICIFGKLHAFSPLPKSLKYAGNSVKIRTFQLQSAVKNFLKVV